MQAANCDLLFNILGFYDGSHKQCFIADVTPR